VLRQPGNRSPIEVPVLKLRSKVEPACRQAGRIPSDRTAAESEQKIRIFDCSAYRRIAANPMLAAVN